ncbi:hypothetical protein D3C76_589640 [compost metagenome]
MCSYRATPALLTILCANLWAAEPSDNMVKGILVSAKFSGGCSMIVQMATFQESTKMPGGDEFLLRFLNMEAARLGFTSKEYMEQCQQAAKVYQTYYDALETTEPGRTP